MKQPTRVLALLTALLLPAAAPAPEPPRRPFRIGVLFWHDSANDKRAWQGVQEGLKVSGMRYVLDRADARREEKGARKILDRWRRTPPDLLFTLGTKATLLAKAALQKTPIVFVAVTDPQAAGLPAPGRAGGSNLTGASNRIHPRLLLRAYRRTLPSLTRLGVLYDPRNPVSRNEVEAARAFLAPRRPEVKGPEEEWEGRLRQQLTLEIRTVSRPADLAAAAKELCRRCDAIWAPIDYMVYQNLAKVTPVTEKRKVPLFSSSLKGIDAAVLGVTVDFRMLGLQAAAMALKILEQKQPPGAIPVATLKWHQLVINLDAARRIGFQVPLAVLCKAEEIIDAQR